MYLPHLSCLALHYFCTPLLSQFRYYLCYLYLRCHILFIASVTITFVVTYYLLPLLPLPSLSHIIYYLCYLYLGCHMLFITPVTFTLSHIINYLCCLYLCCHVRYYLSYLYVCCLILGITSFTFTFVVILGITCATRSQWIRWFKTILSTALFVRARHPCWSWMLESWRSSWWERTTGCLRTLNRLNTLMTSLTSSQRPAVPTSTNSARFLQLLILNYLLLP